MKFTELPDHVIEAAAKTLSRELEGVSKKKFLTIIFKTILKNKK